MDVVYCGASSYECDAAPMMTLICHCRDCQKSTGSANSLVVAVPREQFNLKGDSLKVHHTANGSTNAKRERWFCGECGSPLATMMEEMPAIAVIKAGTLDDTSQIKPTGEIWTVRTRLVADA